MTYSLTTFNAALQAKLNTASVNLSAQDYLLLTKAAQTALSISEGVELLALKGYANGIAGLDANAQVPAENLTVYATLTALDAKAPLASPTFTGTVVLPSTTSIGNVSATELGYVDGVTSAIQTQLDTKAATAGNATQAGTETLTNKTIDASTNTLTGVATLTGTQTLTNKTLTTPTISTPNITGAVTAPAVANSSDGYGYIGTPQASKADNYTLVLADAGKDIFVTVTAKTITIPANSSVAFQIGTGFTVTNESAVTTTIAITTDTLILANSASTGSRTLAPYGVAVFKKVTATKWIGSGNGLT
jgi:hypothetical protein